MHETESARLFFERAYRERGVAAQRRYPNEELVRFLAGHFFPIPPQERSSIRIVELGCGSGGNLWMIAREGFDGYGIDISAEAIDLCRSALSSWNVNANLAVGDMTDTKFSDNQFDAAIDVFSSYCLDEAATVRFLAETARILKPAGLVFSFVPSKQSDAWTDHAPARLKDASTLERIARLDSPFAGNNYPFRFLSREQYMQLLSDAGFDLLSSETVTRSYRDTQEMFEFLVVTARKKPPS